MLAGSKLKTGRSRRAAFISLAFNRGFPESISMSTFESCIWIGNNPDSWSEGVRQPSNRTRTLHATATVPRQPLNLIRALSPNSTDRTVNQKLRWVATLPYQPVCVCRPIGSRVESGQLRINTGTKFIILQEGRKLTQVQHLNKPQVCCTS